ncbi:hypothetical protein OAO15_00905 [bacterium]|jgi:hypothetical protein|nr:hypothetical protein [bacterium]|tara:strand:- start:778 stop:1050 length:273 start_codon:yes stop_codon:yes gene_type:complete
MSKPETKIIEDYILIARRVPPGDKWRLVANEPDGPVHKTLTDTLEAYMTKTGFRGEYRLAPLKSQLYAINTDEVEVKIEPEKKYSIYGEY